MEIQRWYKIEVNEDRLLGGEYHRLCRRFQRAFIAAGAPPQLALLAEMKPLAPRRAIYLSPAAARYAPDLVREHDASPCAAPEMSGVTVVFGVPDAKRHLPGSERALVMDVTPSGSNVIPIRAFDQPRRAAAGP